MEQKHWFFLIGMLLAFPFGLLAACLWQRARDIFVVLLVFCTTMTNQVDVNLIGREAYRAATRGIELSVIDVLATCILVGSLFARRSGSKRWIWPTSLLPMLLYAAYCTGSVMTHEPMLFGIFELSKVLRGIVVFVALATYVRGPRDLQVVIASIAFAVYREGFVTLSDRYLGGVHRNSGTLGHPNNLAIYCSICAPVLGAAAQAEAGKWFRRLCAGGFLLACACVVLTISRTGFAVLLLITTLLGLALIPKRAWMHLSSKRIAFALLVVFGALGVTIKASDSLLSRYQGASLEEEFGEDGMGRGHYWRLGKMVLDDHPFGIGLNNWSWVVTADYYPRMGFASSPYENTDVDFSNKSKQESVHSIAPPAHSLLVLTAGELGYPGALIFGSIWLCWAWSALGFVRRRLPDLLSRFGLGAAIGLLACLIGNLTEYAFRHASIFFLMQVLMGALVAAAAVRPRRRVQAGSGASRAAG